jgi:hypothetical protein
MLSFGAPRLDLLSEIRAGSIRLLLLWNTAPRSYFLRPFR